MSHYYPLLIVFSIFIFNLIRVLGCHGMVLYAFQRESNRGIDAIMVNHIILYMDNYLEINIFPVLFPHYISLGAFGHCHVNSKVDGKSWNILTMKALLDILYVSLIT